MNFSKKLFFIVGLTIVTATLEAGPQKPGGNKPGLPKNQGISEEQLEEMQFIAVLSMEMAVDFMKKHPKFISSLKSAYKNNTELVGKKLLEHCEKHVENNAEIFLKSILKDMPAKELQLFVQQVKPALAPIMVQEIMNWLHITVMSEIA